MRVPHAAPRQALFALSVLLLASCTSERPTEPPDGGAPTMPAGLQARAIALRVDLVAGTVTPVARLGAETAVAPGLSLALLGANEIGATTSNFFRSALGQFAPKKVTVRFDVALTNKAGVALLEPTFPSPPAGVHALLLFPFSTTVTAGSGTVDAGADWDGGLTNFFKEGNCTAKTNTDCYRYEPFPAPLAGGATTAARTVGFDVAPTVTSFMVYFVLAADLQIPGSISGTVTSPQRGPLGGITVTLSPASQFTTTNAQTGGYGFTGLVPGSYTLALSGLPPYCAQVVPKAATVSSGSNATVNFSVLCPYIAFNSDRDGHDEIYRMNADGSDQTRLTTSSTCRNSNPAWSPDGTKIAFQCNLIGSPDPFDPIIDILVMNADGSGQVNITNGATQNQQPDWSPDGRIAFSSHRYGNDEIYVMNADGTGPTRITQTPDSAEFYPSWSPDGSRITFSKMPYKTDNGHIVPSGNDDIWSMKADGSDFVSLYATPGGTDRDPSWSPTGNLIAFWSTNLPPPGGTAVFTVDATDKTAVQRTQRPPLDIADEPEWSTDGSKLVFAGLSATSLGFDIYVMNLDGTGLTNLTVHADQDHFPAWQP